MRTSVSGFSQSGKCSHIAGVASFLPHTHSLTHSLTHAAPQREPNHSQLHTPPGCVLCSSLQDDHYHQAIAFYPHEQNKSERFDPFILSRGKPMSPRQTLPVQNRSQAGGCHTSRKREGWGDRKAKNNHIPSFLYDCYSPSVSFGTMRASFLGYVAHTHTQQILEGVVVESREYIGSYVRVWIQRGCGNVGT